jgi:hypothetical protein
VVLLRNIKEKKVDNIVFILNSLIEEQSENRHLNIPPDLSGKRQLMRSLMNSRPPLPVSEKLLKAQDEELKTQLFEKGIVELNQVMVSPIDKRHRLWQEE